MDIIADEIVMQVWQEVVTSSRVQARKRMTRITKSQPYLLAFVMGTTEELGLEVHELAVYLFVVIYSIFEKASGLVTQIKPRIIDDAYDRNEKFFERFENAHQRFLEKAAESMTYKQPFVMKYLTEALFEAPEGEDPVALSEEDTGFLFLVFKTVIDVLNEAYD